MTDHSLNAAGEALKALGFGAVRLRWRPADDLVERDCFTIWIEAGDNHGEAIGVGDTPSAALDAALGLRLRKAA